MATTTELLTEYDATLDTKRRFVMRGFPTVKHYHVRVYGGKKGRSLLKWNPRRWLNSIKSR